MPSTACTFRRNRVLALATGLACAGVMNWGSPARAVSDTTLNYTYTWEDWGGTNTHPLINNEVSFYDANTSTQLAGPSPPTDNSGQYTLVTDDQFDVNGNLDIYSVLPATVPGVASVYSSAANIATNTPYSIQTPTVAVSLYGSANTSFGVTNTTYAGSAIQALQLITYINEYYSDPGTYDVNLAPINILFNNTITGSSMGATTMNLASTDWCNIDVLMHEYGHYVAGATQANLQAAPLGLQHSFNQDQIGAANMGNGYGATPGSQLAWQEGIATYLGQVAIADGGLSTQIPNLPADAFNSAYDAFNPSNGVSVNPATDLLFSVNINSLNTTTTVQQQDPDDDSGTPPQRAPTSFNFRGYGEGDETSVMRSLWDFENNTNVEAYARAGQSDQSNFGALKVFNLMKGVVANKGTFYGFWKTIDSDLATTPADMAYVGLPASAQPRKALRSWDRSSSKTISRRCRSRSARLLRTIP